MRRLLALLLALLPAASQAALPAVTADTEYYKPSGVSSPFLGIPVGPRAIGMGEAYTATADDVYALHWNPAGLADITEFQIGLMHNEHYSALGIRQEFLAYAHPLNKAALGVSVNYFGLGAIELRGEDGGLDGESSAMAFAGTLGYGQGFGADGNLKLGMAIEFGMENFYGGSSSAFGGSVGLGYAFNENFNFGLAAQHLGAGADGFMPPGTVAGGLAFKTEDRSFVASLEGAMPLSDDPFLRAGAEYTIAGMVSLRGGYRLRLGGDSEGDLLSGYTAGVGFRYNYFTLDYAFVPAGDLTATHRVAATVALPNDFFKPKVVVASTQNTTYARTKYDKGRILYKKGERVAALIEFKQAVDAYPVKDGVKPMRFYFISKKAIANIEKELAKKGGNEKVVKAIARELALGQRYMEKKDYFKAVERYNRALELDENHAQAKSLREEAYAKIRAQKAGLLEKGRQAFAAGQLARGVAYYRKVLEFDAGDATAKKALAAKKNVIRIEIRKLHRKGIDHYVNGRLKQAVTIWNRALELDPDDPVNLKRDLDKAKKLLQLKGEK